MAAPGRGGGDDAQALDHGRQRALALTTPASHPAASEALGLFKLQLQCTDCRHLPAARPATGSPLWAHRPLMRALISTCWPFWWPHAGHAIVLPNIAHLHLSPAVFQREIPNAQDPAATSSTPRLAARCAGIAAPAPSGLRCSVGTRCKCRCFACG